MDDGGFLALVEGVIVWVDERYGQLAAWLVGLAMVTIVPAMILAAALWWFAR